MQRLRESHAGIMNIYDLGKCPSDLLVFVALLSAQEGESVRAVMCVWHRR